ncbi:hypothetical protein L218DRAFT_880729, partial [Marasmius fiardii PR-910]
VFKWVFIPWLQAELDAFTARYNSSQMQHQKDKVLPQGDSPDDMEEYPEEYGFVNFKIPIDPDADYLRTVEELWAPPAHPVFELVPQDFDVLIHGLYNQIGKPEVTQSNVWNIYMKLLILNRRYS